MAGFIDPLDRKNDLPEPIFDPRDINDNRIWAALSYWWILFFLPLVVCPQSYFGKFHANQGLVLLITSVICSAAAIVPILGIFVALAGNVACFVFQLIGTVSALQGRGKRLPVIGEWELIR